MANKRVRQWTFRSFYEKWKAGVLQYLYTGVCLLYFSTNVLSHRIQGWILFLYEYTQLFKRAYSFRNHLDK